MKCGLVGDGELVRSHGEAAPRLQSVDSPFDGIPLLVRGRADRRVRDARMQHKHMAW